MYKTNASIRCSNLVVVNKSSWEQLAEEGCIDTNKFIGRKDGGVLNVKQRNRNNLLVGVESVVK